MYAIQNIKTGKFVYGTDRRYNPWRQRTSEDRMLTFYDKYSAGVAFLGRKCGKDYKIVILSNPEVMEVIEPPKDYSALDTQKWRGVM